MSNCCDTLADTSKYTKSLYKAGIRVVGQYTKEINLAKAKKISKAGIHIFLIFEQHGSINEITAANALIHVGKAVTVARSIGAPGNACIYFAVDTGITPSQVKSNIVPYATALKKAMGNRYRVGLYCPGIGLAAVEKIVDKLWLPNAKGWAGYKAFLASNKWAMVQQLPRKIGGVQVDPNVINSHNPDIGDFIL